MVSLKRTQSMRDEGAVLREMSYCDKLLNTNGQLFNELQKLVITTKDANVLLIINERKIENPIAIALMVLVALSLVGAVIALVLFVLLPLIGVLITGLIAMLFVVITPIILWFVLPVLFLSLINKVFGPFIK